MGQRLVIGAIGPSTPSGCCEIPVDPRLPAGAQFGWRSVRRALPVATRAANVEEGSETAEHRARPSTLLRRRVSAERIGGRELAVAWQALWTPNGEGDVPGRRCGRRGRLRSRLRLALAEPRVLVHFDRYIFLLGTTPAGFLHDGRVCCSVRNHKLGDGMCRGYLEGIRLGRCGNRWR